MRPAGILDLSLVGFLDPKPAKPPSRALPSVFAVDAYSTALVALFLKTKGWTPRY